MSAHRRLLFSRLSIEELEDRRLLTALAPPYYPVAIRTAYGLANGSTGANQVLLNNTPLDGTGQTIAILELNNTATTQRLQTDIHTFDTFPSVNLTDPPNLTVIDAPGVTPASATTDVFGEEDLDMEWAHAMAPGANINIIMVPVVSTAVEFLQIDAAAQYAASLPGVSVVSISYDLTNRSPTGAPLGPPAFPYSPGEYSTETNDDSMFTTPSGHQGVTFVVSTGDDGIASWPATSPNVVSVGGTTLNMTTTTSTTVPPVTTLAYGNEVYWNAPSGGTFATGIFGVGGAGLSQYEAEPSYQQSFQTSGSRSVPDVAMDADFDNTPVEFYIDDPVTGQNALTSLGTSSGLSAQLTAGMPGPLMAGLLADADQGRVLAGGTTLDGRSQALPALYSLPSSDYNAMSIVTDIPFTAISATGLGSPKANLLLPDLAAYGLADQLAVTSEPTSVTAGTAFQISVAAEGKFGNVDHSASGSVVVNGATVGTLSNGVATFSLTLNQASVGTSVQISADGLTTQTFIKVVATGSNQLVISSEPPATVNAGSTFGLAVTALDGFGNVATGFSGSVTVALANNPNNATLSGTLTQTFTAGVATFSDLSLNNDGFGYTLSLTSQGTTLSTSSINVYNTLTITGAAHDSVTVGFADAQDFTVTKNGVKTEYSLAKYDRLVYQGPTHSFSNVVFDDPANTYAATQTLTSTQLVSNDFAFEADNVANLYVYAGSNSTANVTVATGSGGNFYVDAANSGYSYIADPVDGIFSQLIGFGAETVTGSGGSTYAYVYSTSNASVVAAPSGSSVTVGSVKSTLVNFPQLYILGAADGTDQVNLEPGNSVGAEFVGTPTFSYVTGSYKNASFIFGALYSANVVAQPSVYATDTAFFESFANNVFNGGPAASALTGTAANASGASYTFSVQASGYLAVSVLESGSGTDSVNLTSTGHAVFVGTSTVDTLTVGFTTITVNTYVSTTSGTGTVLVPGASRVTVTGAGDSTDSAFMYDSPGGNALVISGNTAVLTTSKGTLSVSKFGALTAERQNGSSDTLHESAVDFVVSTVGNWTSV